MSHIIKDLRNEREEMVRLLRQVLLAERLELPPALLEALGFYYSLSQKWGTKINLTANLAPQPFLQENILDPALAFMALNGARDQAIIQAPWSLADLGCGGGYVGIVWHLLAQGQANTLLIDSDRKKINFCKQVIRELGLSGIVAEQSRVEELKEVSGLDVVVSRATWEPKLFFQKASPLAGLAGWMLHFSSADQAAKTNHEVKIEYTLHNMTRCLTGKRNKSLD